MSDTAHVELGDGIAGLQTLDAGSASEKIEKSVEDPTIGPQSVRRALEAALRFLSGGEP